MFLGCPLLFVFGVLLLWINGGWMERMVMILMIMTLRISRSPLTVSLRILDDIIEKTTIVNP